MDFTLNDYYELLNKVKSVKNINYIQQLKEMELRISSNFIENTPNIWGEYDYLIINITENGLFPIKFKDLDIATEISNQLQCSYFKNGLNPYFTGRIYYKNPPKDNCDMSILLMNHAI